MIPRSGRPWRGAGQPTPVFSLGESHGQRSLVGSSPWGGKESDTTEGTEHEHAVSGNFFSSQFPHHPLFIFRANNFQSPLHLDVTMTLSSGQWNVGGSDVCQFTEWPVSTSFHGLSPFPLWLGEVRKLHSLSPRSKLGKPLLKTADVRAEEVCWRAPCIYPTPITSPTSPQTPE